MKQNTDLIHHHYGTKIVIMISMIITVIARVNKSNLTANSPPTIEI